jgi:hypothetical protein
MPTETRQNKRFRNGSAIVEREEQFNRQVPRSYSISSLESGEDFQFQIIPNGTQTMPEAIQDLIDALIEARLDALAVR